MIRAITLDLDDTLWPVWPVIVRAEEALHNWLTEHAPRTAQRYPVTAMRALRQAVLARHPEISIDFSAQRRRMLQWALRDSGDDEALLEPAFSLYTQYRNRVDFFPGVEGALAWLAKRYPVAALTNGTADLSKIGIHQHFVFGLSAREHGTAKPDPAIFHAACERLGLLPGEVLHVGDDPELDVLGAQRIGMKSAWINRQARPWSQASPSPDFIVGDLSELADCLGRSSIEQE